MTRMGATSATSSVPSGTPSSAAAGIPITVMPRATTSANPNHEPPPGPSPRTAASRARPRASTPAPMKTSEPMNATAVNASSTAGAGRAGGEGADQPGHGQRREAPAHERVLDLLVRLAGMVRMARDTRRARPSSRRGARSAPRWRLPSTSAMRTSGASSQHSAPAPTARIGRPKASHAGVRHRRRRAQPIPIPARMANSNGPMIGTSPNVAWTAAATTASHPPSARHCAMGSSRDGRAGRGATAGLRSGSSPSGTGSGGKCDHIRRLPVRVQGHGPGRDACSPRVAERRLRGRRVAAEDEHLDAVARGGEAAEDRADLSRRIGQSG